MRMYEKLNPEKTASISIQKPVTEKFVSIEEPKLLYPDGLLELTI